MKIKSILSISCTAAILSGCQIEEEDSQQEYALPLAPSDIKSLYVKDALELNWSDNSNNETYFEAQVLESSGHWSAPQIVSADINSVALITPPKSETVRVKIRSGNQTGVSEWVEAEIQNPVVNQTTPPPDSNLASIISPAQGQVLTVGESVEFKFSGSSKMWLDIGTEKRGSNIVDQRIKGNSFTLSRIPRTSMLYVTLWSQIDGQWKASDYEFEVAEQNGTALSKLTSPEKGEVLTAGQPLTLKFETADDLYLDIGTSRKGSDIVNMSINGKNEYQLSSIPEIQMLYVTLWSRPFGKWEYLEYAFEVQEKDMPTDPAIITSPVEGTQLESGSAVKFEFTPADELRMEIGITENGKEVYDGPVSGTEFTLETVPEAERLYVALFTRQGNEWLDNRVNYEIVESSIPDPDPDPISEITVPAIGSRLKAGQPATFEYNPASELKLTIGTEINGKDLYDGPVDGTRFTLTEVPDAEVLYLTLFTKVSDQWLSKNYSYEIENDNGPTDPEPPGGNGPNDPEPSDPEEPGGNGPLDPEPTDPEEPGDNGPSDPEPTDPENPGGNGPSDPEPTDPEEPGGNGPSDPEPTDPETPTLSDYEATLLTLVNEARSVGRECGGTYYPAANSVVHHPSLTAAALEHTNNMARLNFFSHTGKDGSSYDDRAKKHGFPGYWAGENIAAGYYTPEDTMKGWLKSSGHCRHIMNKNHTHFGAGKAENANSDYKVYWALMLGY